LLFILDGAGFFKTRGGAINWARASRGCFMVTGASAETGNDIDGTMVGEVVSKTIFSGHR
jgi:hypothetical protein